MFRVKRVYDPPEPGDGLRVLVDRLWPRGLSREAAQVNHWLRDVAPSKDLRNWFAHDPVKWETFAQRYEQELAANPETVNWLLEQGAAGPVTLLFGAQDRARNNAVVLQAYLNRLEQA